MVLPLLTLNADLKDARARGSFRKIYNNYIENAKKQVWFCPGYETFSGKHTVTWTTTGNINKGQRKEFSNMAEAFAFAKKKATALGDGAALSSSLPLGHKYGGSWVVAEGKLRFLY